MSFELVWARLVSKQPKLDGRDAVVEIKASQLKKLLEQVYDRGKRAGREDVLDTGDWLSDLWRKSP